MSARPPDRRRPYLGRAVIQPPVAAGEAPAASGGSAATLLHDDKVWLRADLADHVPYSSPRPWVGVRLDSNESPYPPPNGLRVKLADLAGEHPWHRYGDLDAVALRTRLGEWHRQAAEGVWVAAGVWEARNIAVRDVSGLVGLAGHLRVTVGTPLENDAFLAALPEVLA